jgi:hypothetical protein
MIPAGVPSVSPGPIVRNTGSSQDISPVQNSLVATPRLMTSSMASPANEPIVLNGPVVETPMRVAATRLSDEPVTQTKAGHPSRGA